MRIMPGYKPEATRTTREARPCLGVSTYGYETALAARISRDPLGDPLMRMMAGAPGMPQDAETRELLSSELPVEMLEGPNLYQYVLNNPVNLLDPLGLDYLDNYLNYVNQYAINPGPAAAALLGGVWPKSLSPATGGRCPMLGSKNPLTSVPRALGVPGSRAPLVRGGAAAIGVATVAAGFWNIGIYIGGLGAAAGWY